MTTCKAKLLDGKTCPNKVDDGQEYCPYHLANQVTKAKNILSIVGTVFGVVATGVFAVLKLVAKRRL